MKLIYTKDPENAVAQKILAAASVLDISLEVQHLDSYEPNTDPDFIAEADPDGYYPVLELKDELVTLFEANAILRYIARLDEQGDSHHLYGRTPFEASQVDMWIDFSTAEMDAASEPFVREAFKDKGLGPADKVPAGAIDAIEKVLTALDEVLSIRTFLVGERMSIADIAVAFSMQWIYRCTLTQGVMLAKKYRAVYRHYNTVMRHPKVRLVMKKEGATLAPLRS